MLCYNEKEKNMNNLGTNNLYSGIQAMSLPVRYIKKKQPVKNTVKTPMNFVSTNLVTSKKIPSHINIQKTVIEQPYNLNKEKQSGAMTEIYVPSDEIRKALYAQKQKKRMASQNIYAERKHKESSKNIPVANNELTDEDIIAALFVIGICMGIIEVASHIDFEREENLKQLVAEYEQQEQKKIEHQEYDNRMWASTIWTMRQIAADDAEKENLYDLWLQDRDWINELNKAVAEYEKSVQQKTKQYNHTLKAYGMVPTKKKKQTKKTKNPKGKRETFVLKGGSMPKRYVAPKPVCKRALKDMAALFNGARRDIAIMQTPGKIR